MINDRRVPMTPKPYYAHVRGSEVVNGFKCPRCRDIVWSFNTGLKLDRCYECGQTIDYESLKEWKG